MLAFAHKTRTMFSKDVMRPQSGKGKLDGQLPVILEKQAVRSFIDKRGEKKHQR